MFDPSFGEGLLPKHPHTLPGWIGSPLDALAIWAAGVRHLRCPRRLLQSPFRTAERPPASIGSDGRDTPLALATDDALRESVRDWYRKTFGVRIDLIAQGSYLDLVTGNAAPGRRPPHRTGGPRDSPTCCRSRSRRCPRAGAGPGVDIIEHPEAELHPAAHAEIAELLLGHLAGPERPLIVETHSEMILLRARRWVAEGKLPAGHVLVYWIHTEPGRGSLLQKIGIRENGEMETWPDGVFIEDYEEILAIRRAARGRVEG